MLFHFMIPEGTANGIWVSLWSDTFSCMFCLFQSCNIVKTESKKNSKYRTIGLKNVQLPKEKNPQNLINSVFLIFIFSLLSFVFYFQKRQKTAKIIDGMMPTSQPHTQLSLFPSFAPVSWISFLLPTTDTHFLLP